MTITKKLHTAAAIAIATAGLAASPALAVQHAGAISNGPATPTVKWDHDAWKKCWAGTYAQWREDGSSPNVSQAA
ncbi:MAG: hypothetical protein JWQ18_753, partial [Conexibacter sp.]|nr:hypothetical protein [Conexibacter sp.]